MLFAINLLLVVQLDALDPAFKETFQTQLSMRNSTLDHSNNATLSSKDQEIDSGM